MGGFFLFRSDAAIERDAVRQVFSKKRFAAPKEFTLGRMTLWLYRKQLVNEENYYFADPNTAVFATGTVVYRGRSYRDTLTALLDDFRHRCLDFEEIIGSFCLIFFTEGRIQILTDRLNVQHVFMDQKQTRLSSSFLALLASHQQRLPLDRLALYEKLCTGYIIGPDTLVSGIRQVTDGLQEATRSDDFSFIRHPQRAEPVRFCSAGLEACVDYQLAVLARYFHRIGPLAAEYGPELGLSSGYDSRLLLCLSENLPVPLAVHTHWTEGSHELEKSIVEQLVKVHGHQLRSVKTQPMERKSESELSAILADGLYYFDGRNAYDMGAFSETYTRQYKLKTLGPRRLSLNGLGGEIYRNSYHSPRGRLSFKAWMANHVYYQFAAHALRNPDLREHLHDYIVRKLTAALDRDLTGRVDQLTVRRYFAEVRMPDCDGINNNAHNQLVFYLTPFIEHGIIREAYKATPYIGLSGRFEAAMIARLDRTIADIPGHYGFPLTKEPLRYRLGAALRGYMPEPVRATVRRWRIRHGDVGRESLDRYCELLGRSPTLQEIENVLREYAADVDIRTCMRDEVHKQNVIYVGSFLREFHGRLRK